MLGLLVITAHIVNTYTLCPLVMPYHNPLKVITPTFQMMKLPSCNSQGSVFLEHIRSVFDKAVFGVYEKKRFYILSDSFLF